MKKVFSVLLCVFSVLVFSSSALFSGSAYAVTSPITWDDVSEDVIALRDSYYKLWSESSNFSEFFKNASDIPVKWVTTLADGTAALSPFNGLLFSKTEEAHKVDYTGSSPKIKHMIDNGEITPEKPVISSDDFADGIEKANTNLTPKSSGLFLNSYRTNTVLYGQVLYKLNADRFSTTRYVLHDDGKSALLQDLYYIPFYMDKNYNYYYSEYQYHIYFAPYEGTNSDIALFIDVYSPSDLEPSGFLSYPSFSDKIEFNSQSMPFQIALSITSRTVFVYPDEDTYVNGGNTLKYNWLSSFPDPNNYKYYLPDKSSYENTYSGFDNGFGYRYDKHDYQNNKPGSLIDDLGFICSKSMISRTYTDIDTTQIPSGQVVTITGDTIYNYTITNPDTGESSGFGDYITNNYTYITNNYGDGESSGSGSGSSGNVTVGGSIDVGGSVGVDINVNVPDININVNGNGGAGESGSSIANPDDFTSADNVDLNKYYDTAVEQSTGFQKFLKDFFGFLPPELLGVILFAVAMAIVCRVFGR